MNEQIRTRRAPRPGRPDGSSQQAVFVAHWVDEDSGAHTATVPAHDEQEVRDLIAGLVDNNTLTIRRVHG